MNAREVHLRRLSLLAALGELAARSGSAEDGVHLLDQETSMRWLLAHKHLPFASPTSLKHHGYQGETDQIHEDLVALVEREYVGFTPMHDGYGLTPKGLAVYHGKAEFAD